MGPNPLKGQQSITQMTHNMTIYRDHEPLSLIIRATITRNYDAAYCILGILPNDKLRHGAKDADLD
jgi:hypothetical protein